MKKSPQMTLARELACSGKALFSGKEAKIVLQPAPENCGLIFIRQDLKNRPEILANPEAIIPTPVEFRCTALGIQDRWVYPVEHLLAALYAKGISNARILVQGAELPFFDGSARPFWELLEKTGVEKQSAPRPALQVPRELKVSSEDGEIELSPSKQLEMDYRLEHPHPAIGRQHYHFEFSQDAFAREIAPARTFCTEAEGQAFVDSGGKGGDLENCLVFGKQGLQGNGLRFPEEPARHKILDLLGDLALLGCEIHAKIAARKSGHRLNAMLLKKITDQVR